MEIIEGTWEEIASRAEELKGKRFKLIPATKPIESTQAEKKEQGKPEPNWAALRILEKLAKSQADRRRTSSEHTLKIIREGRAGAMWGYEPLEDEKPEVNTGMLRALEEIQEGMQGMREISGEDTNKLIREARAGGMYGYEPLLDEPQE